MPSAQFYKPGDVVIVETPYGRTEDRFWLAVVREVLPDDPWGASVFVDSYPYTFKRGHDRSALTTAARLDLVERPTERGTDAAERHPRGLQSPRTRERVSASL